MTIAAEISTIFDQFKSNISEAGVNDIVSYTVGDSKDVLPNLDDQHYQIIFIDGSHKYEDVIFDIKQGLRLISDGGILCGDDLELHIQDVDPNSHYSALLQGIDFTHDPKSLASYHPGVSQAVSEVFANVSSRDGFWAMKRDGNAWVKIDFSVLEPVVPEHLAQFVSPKVVYAEFGFNIIFVQKKYVACRQLLGPIDWDRPLEELNQKYPRPDFAIERSLLGARIHVCCQAINGLNVGSNHNSDGIKNQKTPIRYGEYKGYNLVVWEGRFLALRKSGGFVDVYQDFAALVKNYPFGDVLLSDTNDGLLLVIESYLHQNLIANAQRMPELAHSFIAKDRSPLILWMRMLFNSLRCWRK
jgi:hypothetical protein